MTFNNTTPVNFLDASANARASSGPFVDIFQPRDPTTSDIASTNSVSNIAIQQRWLNTSTNTLWLLKNYNTANGVTSANWIKIGGSNIVETLTGNDGIVVPPTGNNINVLGDEPFIVVTGNAATSTLTISPGASLAAVYTEDTGTAIPSLGNLNVLRTTGSSGSGSGVSTIGSGDTISIQMNSPFSLSDFTFSGNTASTSRTVTISNLSNTSGSNAVQMISVAGSSAGDPYTEYRAGGNHSAVVGYMNSANEFVIGTGANGITPETASPYFLLRPSFPDILLQVPHVNQNVNSASGALFTIQNQNTSATGTAIINVISGGALSGADSYIDFTNFTVATNYAMGHQVSTDNFIFVYGGDGTLSGGNLVYSITNTGQTTFSKQLGFNQSLIANTTVPSAYPYTVLATDYFISVNSSAGAHTINLPNAPTTNQIYIVKDSTGNANANNITITTPGGSVLIDGSTSATISTNYGVLRVIFNGTKYLTW